MRQQREGFLLMEVLVATAVILVLAAAFLPNLLASTDRALVERAAVTLEDLSDAITDARFDNQDWPKQLSHLTVPITTAQTNICDDAYNAGRVNNWNGPYYGRPIPLSGMPLGIGTVRDTLERLVISGNPKGGGAISEMRMTVEEVPEEHALELNRIVDGDGDGAGGASAGTIRWSGVDASGLVTVQWVRIIKGC